jgi:hypothetical protein
MKEYRIADAREPIDKCAAVAAVDLAWARPHRNGVYVTYPTYSPPGLWEFVDAVYDSLLPGGWALFDCDDWLLPRLINYLREDWGDVAATYSGGGYRRTGTVIYDSHPGGGRYFTNGGYHVVFAHKGDTDRESAVSSKQIADRPENYDWGTPKPTVPYRAWIPSVMDRDELLYVPCAGTAPAAIALEMEYGDDAQYICVDSESDAKSAFTRRRTDEIDNTQLTFTEVTNA